MLTGHLVKPPGAAVGVGVLDGIPAKPIRPLHPVDLTKAGVARDEGCVQRGAADIPGAGRLIVRPVHPVEPTQALPGPPMEIAAAALMAGKALNVDGSGVKIRRTGGDPRRQRPAHARGVDDPLGVHARGDK